MENQKSGHTFEIQTDEDKRAFILRVIDVMWQTEAWEERVRSNPEFHDKVRRAVAIKTEWPRDVLIAVHETLLDFLYTSHDPEDIARAGWLRYGTTVALEQYPDAEDKSHTA